MWSDTLILLPDSLAGWGVGQADMPPACQTENM